MRDFVFDQFFRSTVEGDLNLIIGEAQGTDDVAIAKRSS
jgi:hypothetical protein